MVIQDLIGEIREDVAVQFAARQIEYEAFRETIKRAPGSSSAAEDIIDQHASGILSLWPRASSEIRKEWRERLSRSATIGDFPFAAMRVRYLEYGTARVPDLIRRP